MVSMSFFWSSAGLRDGVHVVLLELRRAEVLVLDLGARLAEHVRSALTRGLHALERPELDEAERAREEVARVVGREHLERVSDGRELEVARLDALLEVRVHLPAHLDDLLEELRVGVQARLRVLHVLLRVREGLAVLRESHLLAHEHLLGFIQLRLQLREQRLRVLLLLQLQLLRVREVLRHLLEELVQDAKDFPRRALVVGELLRRVGRQRLRFLRRLLRDELRNGRFDILLRRIAERPETVLLHSIRELVQLIVRRQNVLLGRHGKEIELHLRERRELVLLQNRDGALQRLDVLRELDDLGLVLLVLLQALLLGGRDGVRQLRDLLLLRRDLPRELVRALRARVDLRLQLLNLCLIREDRCILLLVVHLAPTLHLLVVRLVGVLLLLELRLHVGEQLRHLRDRILALLQIKT